MRHLMLLEADQNRAQRLRDAVHGALHTAKVDLSGFVRVEVEWMRVEHHEGKAGVRREVERITSYGRALSPFNDLVLIPIVQSLTLMDLDRGTRVPVSEEDIVRGYKPIEVVGIIKALKQL